MKFALSLLVTTWLINATGFGAVAGDDGAVAEAIQRALCYDVYWNGQEYELGKRVPVKIKVDGERVRARIDNVLVYRKFRTSLVLDGIREGARVSAAITKGYEPRSAPPEERREFEHGVIDTVVSLPKDCTPRFDPSTPRKEQVVATVIETIRNFLLSGYLFGERLPREVTITIANFNLDYPKTFVLVEPGRKVYSVTLHDPSDYGNTEYWRREEYRIGPVYGRWQTEYYIRKIRAHALVKKSVFVRP
jgi:hypothetical protein